MMLRRLLLLNAAVSLGNAGLALAAPTASLSLYGMMSGPEVALMARYAAVGSVAVGLLALFASGMDAAGAIRGIVMALCVSDVAGLLVSLEATVMGRMNEAGWGLVVVYLLFAAGYGHYLLRAPRPLRT